MRVDHTMFKSARYIILCFLHSLFHGHFLSIVGAGPCCYWSPGFPGKSSLCYRHSYLGPSFSNILGPCSCHSCFEIHMFSLSAMIFASTAPPRNTMCLRRGGSSILTLNLFNRSGFPCNTLVNHSCFNSFSNLLGKPGYMLLPPDKTIALYRLLR